MRISHIARGCLALMALTSYFTVVAAESEQAPTPNVFAQALILGQEIRTKIEALEQSLFNPAITSPEIDAARKKVNTLTLRWSGNLSEEGKADILQELTDARKTLRDLVFAHADVKHALAVLDADKAKLLELKQRILSIRAQQKQEQSPVETPASKDAIQE